MSQKWIRAKQWDDRNLPAAFDPARHWIGRFGAGKFFAVLVLGAAAYAALWALVIEPVLGPGVGREAGWILPAAVALYLAWPIKFVLRTLSSIPFAVVLLPADQERTLLILVWSGALASLGFGRAIDRRGPRGFVAAGMASEALGLTAFAYAGSLPTVALAGAAIGAGNGLFFTGLGSVLSRLERGPALERAFSVRSWLINLANSVGALTGGVVVGAAGEAALAPAYLVNAATSVGLAAALLAIPLGAAAAEPEAARAPVAWTRALRALVAANALVLVFGVAMFEAVVPYLFVGGRAGTVPLAHAVVGASTVAIALVQLPIGRWSERRAKPRALALGSVLWAAAAAFGLAAIRADGAALWALGVGYGIVFGVGECLYAAAFQPLVVQLVAAPQLARVNGVLSATFSVALATGPSLGFALADHGSPYAFWAATIGALVGASALWRVVGRASAAAAPATAEGAR